MRYLSLFSGIEAATAAWETLGFEPVAFCEINRPASVILEKHYSHVPNLGDVVTLRDRLLAGEDVVGLLSNPPDVVVGGPPCQPFSISGARKGLSDHRGNLTLVYAEIINAINPRIIVWENVPGVLSSRDNAFGYLLGALAGEDGPLVPSGKKWTNAGAVSGPIHGAGPERNLAWRVLDVQYFGVAQRRRRLFLVGCRRDGSNPDPWEILFESEGVRRDSPPRRETGEAVTGTLAARTHGGGFPGTDEACAGYIRAEPPVAAYGGNRTGVRNGVKQQDARLSVATALSTRNTRMFESETFIVHSVTGEISHTLRAEGFDASEDGTGRGTPIIAFDCKAGGNTGFSIDYHTAGTLRGEGHGGGHAAIAFALRGSENGAVPEIYDDGNTTGALRTSNGGSSRDYLVQSSPHDYIAFSAKDHGGDVSYGVSPTLRAGSHHLSHANSGNWMAILPDDSAPHRAEKHYAEPRVRRLMPHECERLQGFPDGYTEGLADGPRYKCVGNSMAVPVMRWIGKRLKKLDRRSSWNK